MRKLYTFIFLFLFLFFGVNACFSQEQKLWGKLTDKNTKQPLAFANIVVKGTSKGVTTDINGSYEL